MDSVGLAVNLAGTRQLVLSPEGKLQFRYLQWLLCLQEPLLGATPRARFSWNRDHGKVCCRKL